MYELHADYERLSPLPAVYRRRLDQLAAEEGPEARDAAAAEFEAEWVVESQPWEAAAKIILDDVIAPRETREVIATGIDFASGSRSRVTAEWC
jgi:methylmalonyl-CoA decarboxylase subunit alpha